MNHNYLNPTTIAKASRAVDDQYGFHEKSADYGSIWIAGLVCGVFVAWCFKSIRDLKKRRSLAMEMSIKDARLVPDNPFGLKIYGRTR